jgi:hypothetical protein
MMPVGDESCVDTMKEPLACGSFSFESDQRITLLGMENSLFRRRTRGQKGRGGIAWIPAFCRTYKRLYQNVLFNYFDSLLPKASVQGAS